MQYLHERQRAADDTIDKACQAPSMYKRPSLPFVGTDMPRQGDSYQIVVNLLRGMILGGDLQPGASLLEIVLSAQLGTSRTPAREAFRTLAAEGLVSLQSYRSATVAALDEDAAADALAVLGSLETLAGRLACDRITEVQLQALDEQLELLESYFEVRDQSGYNHADQRTGN
jgi:DNA-binding GntR family transcriptional regulator